MNFKCYAKSIFIYSVMITAISSNMIAQSITYEDGVKVVHNSKKEKWGSDKKIKLEQVKILGKLDTEDENFMFYRPEDIDTDNEGHIYVLDAGNHRIQKYDREGKYLLTIGRPGQGPGEFSRPVNLEVDDEGNVYVLDVGNRRIQVFNPEGMHRRDIKIENVSAKFHILKSKEILMVNQGIVINVDESNKKPLPLFRIIDNEGKVRGKFGEPENFDDVLLNNRGNKINFAVDDSGNIFVSFRSRNNIEKYGSDRKLLMKIDRPLDYSLDFKKGKVGDEYGVPSITKMPEFPIVSTGIDVDNQGRIWVLTQKRQLSEEEKMSLEVDIVRTSDGGAIERRNEQRNTGMSKNDIFQIEIFDREGVLLKRFPLTHFADAIKIQRDRVYVLDKYRTMQLFVYKLTMPD